MSAFFHEALYRPLLNLLFLIYGFISSDLGIAIIIMTIIIRFILLPIFYKSAKDQTIMQKLAPKIREIQKKHKDNKEQQTREMMAMYKEHQVNPFSSIGLLLLQLPILWTLYRLFLGGFGDAVITQLYSFVPHPESVNYMFLNSIALNEKNTLLVIIAAVFQFLQTFLLMRVARKNTTMDTDNPAMAAAQKMSQRMMYFMPILTVFILSGLPSAIALYWLTTSAFSTVQQLIINKKLQKNDQGGNVSGN